jgi:hypothetical protein
LEDKLIKGNERLFVDGEEILNMIDVIKVNKKLSWQEKLTMSRKRGKEAAG